MQTQLRSNYQMDDMHARLLNALLAEGQQVIAEELALSKAEVSRKCNGENGFTLEQLARLFERLGIEIVTTHENYIIIDEGKYNALLTLANEKLNDERRRIVSPRVVVPLKPNQEDKSA